jgi:hypothetical protein
MSGSAMISIRFAMSMELFAMGPGWSEKGEMGTMPRVERRPRLGLSPKRAARPAGTTIEPNVSVPRETGAYPEATAIAEPDEDPPGFCMTCD